MQGEKRGAILEAALQVFARHGYAAARMSDIAAAAGVGKGTVYLYFSSKEDLLMGVFEARVNEILSMIDEMVVSRVSPREGLKTFFDAALGLVASNVELLDLFEQRVFLSDAFFHSMIQRVVSKLTEEAKTELVLDYDMEIIATAIIGALASYRLYRVLHPRESAETSLRKVSAELSRFFAAAFLIHPA